MASKRARSVIIVLLLVLALFFGWIKYSLYRSIINNALDPERENPSHVEATEPVSSEN